MEVSVSEVTTRYLLRHDITLTHAAFSNPYCLLFCSQSSKSREAVEEISSTQAKFLLLQCLPPEPPRLPGFNVVAIDTVDEVLWQQSSAGIEIKL